MVGLLLPVLPQTLELDFNPAQHFYDFFFLAHSGLVSAHGVKLLGVVIEALPRVLKLFAADEGRMQ